MPVIKHYWVGLLVVASVAIFMITLAVIQPDLFTTFTSTSTSTHSTFTSSLDTTSNVWDSIKALHEQSRNLDKRDTSSEEEPLNNHIANRNRQGLVARARPDRLLELVGLHRRQKDSVTESQHIANAVNPGAPIATSSTNAGHSAPPSSFATEYDVSDIGPAKGEAHIYAYGTKHNIAVLTANVQRGEYVQTVVNPAKMNRLIDVTMPNMKTYCALHGYDLVVVTKILDTNRALIWSKIVAMQHFLSKYEWILWIDMDVIFANMTVRIEDRYDNTKDMILVNDHGGFNAGVMLVHSTQWTEKFLANVYARTDTLNHGHQEQEALKLELNKEPNTFTDHVKLYPYAEKRHLQAYLPMIGTAGVPHWALQQKQYADYKPGDWIIHGAGAFCMPIDECLQKYTTLARAAQQDALRLCNSQETCNPHRIPINPAFSQHAEEKTK